MKARSTTSTKKILIAALVAFAPAGSALAAGDCAGDPFEGYHRAFRADGGAYVCQPAARQPGARGPAGPVMGREAAACRNDPHRRVQAALWADGPSYECTANGAEPAGAQGRAGPVLKDRISMHDPFYRYQQAFTAD